MHDGVYIGQFDKYIGMSHEDVINGFIEAHSYEVSKLKKRIKQEEDCIAMVRKLLKDSNNLG